LEKNAGSGTIGFMDANDTVQKVIGEVEALTGCPVVVSQDASIRKMAVLDIARGSARIHQIRLHPSFRNEAAYLTCFECGFILRKFAVTPEARVDFAADPKGRREIEKLIREHYANRPLPADVLRGLCGQLFDGLMSQLISIPSSMRVDSWIADSFPELAEQQKTMVTRQLQEALGSLRPEARKVAPEGVVKPSLTINAAYALFWSLRWDDPLLAMPYRSMNLGVVGSRLLEIYVATPPDPQHDRLLIDAWAKELRLTNLYRWIPYSLDEY
jgi:hypothetical protein